MEVTTVSPSPASPTEGDDLCETHVTTVAIHCVTLLICLCGLVGNGAVLWLLSLKTENMKILGLAVIDFLVLLLTVPTTLIFLVEDISCSPVVPLLYLNFLFQLSVVSCYWGLYWVMPSSPVVYMLKLFQLCCHCDLPLRLFWLLHMVQYWAFFVLFTVIPAVTFLCPSHEQEHCRTALISMYTIILLLFAVPMLISRSIDFINARWGSQQHQPKRRDIVINLVVFFTLLLILWNFLQQLGYTLVSSQVVFLFTCITSSFKPLIYFLAGRCWRPSSMPSSMGSLRLSLQSVFEEPEENNDQSFDPAMDTMI